MSMDRKDCPIWPTCNCIEIGTMEECMDETSICESNMEIVRDLCGDALTDEEREFLK